MKIFRSRGLVVATAGSGGGCNNLVGGLLCRIRVLFGRWC